MLNNNTRSKLTAPEIANLWTQFLNDSMALCMNTYLLKKCSDEQICSILKFSTQLSKSHLEKIKLFLRNENHPIPKGFANEDVNYDAPPLFSDHIMLVYSQIMALHGINSYSLCMTTSLRADQRSYFEQCISETIEMYNKLINLMLKKGILSKPPIMNPPREIDFLDNQNFLTGWFGKKRPLNAIEISGIHYNMQKTVVKVILEIGFSQVTQSEECRDYFLRGVKLCEKHLKELGMLLAKEHLPTPKSWHSEVTNSTVAPFSDKLMLFHVVSLVSVAVGYLSTALSGSQRRDIIFKYTKQIGEMGFYAEDGINLLIKNNWMEQPPTVDDREALAKNQ